jgi:hypothetical protein
MVPIEDSVGSDKVSAHGTAGLGSGNFHCRQDCMCCVALSDSHDFDVLAHFMSDRATC